MRTLFISAVAFLTLLSGGEDKPKEPLPERVDVVAYVEEQKQRTLERFREEDPEVIIDLEINKEIKRREKLKMDKKKREQEDLVFRAFANTTFNLETGYGKSSMWLNMNNPGGLKCNAEGQRCSSDNYRYFSSKEEGMKEKDKVLRGYYDKYGTDFKTIRAIYCQCGPEDYPKFMKMYHEEYRRLSLEAS